MESSTKQSIIFHERPIVDIKFHPEGELFFSASKDASAAVVDLQGQVMGTFDKHEGAITTLCPADTSLLTAGADLLLIQWDIVTGKCIRTLDSESVVRSMDFTDGVYLCTDDSMNKESFLGRVDLREGSVPLTRITALKNPPTKLFKADECLVYSTVSGTVCKFDLRNNAHVQEVRIHHSKVSDMKPSAKRGFFVTSSIDCTAKLVDTESFQVKKTFDREIPINSTAILNTNDKVVCVGGINARDVTVTRENSFDTDFYDIVTQKKIGSYKTHFGTVNSIDVHPKGTHYASGGEDGSICLVKMGDDFFKAPFSDIFSKKGQNK